MKKDAAKIFFQPSYIEKDVLEAYCKHHQRSKSDVLREFIRTLPDYRSQVTEKENAPLEVTADA